MKEKLDIPKELMPGSSLCFNQKETFFTGKLFLVILVLFVMLVVLISVAGYIVDGMIAEPTVTEVVKDQAWAIAECVKKMPAETLSLCKPS
jgi:hypothetical protein